ncbi:MAG: M28 family peptidase, partial [Polyangia bacterium]
MTPTRSPSFLHYALALSVTGLVALLVLIHHPPPRPKPVDCEAKQFSAERARADIASLTAFGPRPVGLNGQPHPEAHRQARDFVMQRLRDLGLSPELQIGPSCLRDRCAQVENIIARRAAAGLADQREPLVLLSHYDSVARGPGAGDAASGVATILEVLRALEVQAIWQRPLVVVIDDGEEAGLLGARLLPSHRWLSRVAAVLNHEARGTGGQTAMFEASRHSTWLVEAYATSVERPMAASAIYPLYKLLPNDTDLTVLQAAGWRGLNFAFAERAHQYHTAQDS